MDEQESHERQRGMGVSGIMQRRLVRIEQAINDGYRLGMIDWLVQSLWERMDSQFKMLFFNFAK